MSQTLLLGSKAEAGVDNPGKVSRQRRAKVRPAGGSLVTPGAWPSGWGGNFQREPEAPPLGFRVGAAGGAALRGDEGMQSPQPGAPGRGGLTDP